MQLKITQIDKMVTDSIRDGDPSAFSVYLMLRSTGQISDLLDAVARGEEKKVTRNRIYKLCLFELNRRRAKFRRIQETPVERRERELIEIVSDKATNMIRVGLMDE